MSLTSMLKRDEVLIKLFKSLPDLKPLFKTLGYYPEPFPEVIKPLVYRFKNADPANVGRAYDFWLRAYIQRLNNKLVEDELSLVVQTGIETVLERADLNDITKSSLKNGIDRIWDKRRKYITEEEDISLQEVLKDSLVLAHFEQICRERNQNKEIIPFAEVSNNDLQDLINIVNLTVKIKKFFKTDKNIVMNPTFGKYSKAVGGADADFIIGHTIFDIKTTTYYNYKEDYIWQLLGYYLLSKYDENFPVEIEQVALFYARFNKIIYFSIKDLKEIFKLDLFSKYFHDYIVYEDEKDILTLSEEELKNKFLKFKNK